MQKKYRLYKKFREKQLKAAKKWAKDHREEILKKNRIAYANRTKQQIEKRKKYLKKLTSTQSFKDRENKRNRKAYANRTVQQIKERKEYLKQYHNSK